jgi:hypothetical protein
MTNAIVTKRRWSDLSERNRRLLLLGAAFEGSLKVAALVDLKRRPADQLRGSKWAWAIGLVLVNSVGAFPLAYLLVGRRNEDRAGPQGQPLARRRRS